VIAFHGLNHVTAHILVRGIHVSDFAFVRSQDKNSYRILLPVTARRTTQIDLLKQMLKFFKLKLYFENYYFYNKSIYVFVL